MTPQPWEVRDNYPFNRGAVTGMEYKQGVAEFYVERDTGQGTERAAICWDYGIACVIEAALNLRDGTVG